MNRTELVDAVATTAHLSMAAATTAVDAVFDTITEAMQRGEDVRLVGFGTFSVAARAASEGRNPRTGEKIQIAASKQAKWKPGKRLKDDLNPAEPEPEPAISRSQERRLSATGAERLVPRRGSA